LNAVRPFPPIEQSHFGWTLAGLSSRSEIAGAPYIPRLVQVNAQVTTQMMAIGEALEKRHSRMNTMNEAIEITQNQEWQRPTTSRDQPIEEDR
jgi:hypothetical protein